MIPADTVVHLSRLQFAMTALYHFLFVPLTLGLSVLLAVMESIYVMTNRPIWRQMVKYWSVLFGINFVMGVATGITMEFQFGTNWAYYSHFVGDIFGAPLAIEGLMAFFLEATFAGLFFFGWERLSKVQHMCVTWLLAMGTNLSALWILVANGWMQHPVGAHFDFATMRMEVSNFYDVFFNSVAQAKFVHTISAGYVTGAMFVMSVSAYFLLRGRNKAFACRSMTVAASFGLAAALSVVVLGDESGYTANESQKMKIAAMEAIWKTEPAPAGLTLFAIPDQQARENHYEIKIPYVVGLIATRSFSREVPGIDNLVSDAKERIKRGMIAYEALERLRKNPDQPAVKTIFEHYQNDLGYAFLLKKYTDDVMQATPDMIAKAAKDTEPKVAPLFFSFRVMVACGMFFIAFFAVAFFLAMKRRILENRWFLHIAFWSLPLPWIASELGWFVAEYGRQPWVVQGYLPTFLGTSSLSTTAVVLSLTGFVVFYSILAVVEIMLMKKYIQLGPDGLQHKKSH